jgi:hypothetical protein
MSHLREEYPSNPQNENESVHHVKRTVRMVLTVVKMETVTMLLLLQKGLRTMMRHQQRKEMDGRRNPL